MCTMSSIVATFLSNCLQFSEKEEQCLPLAISVWGLVQEVVNWGDGSGDGQAKTYSPQPVRSVPEQQAIPAEEDEALWGDILVSRVTRFLMSR